MKQSEETLRKWVQVISDDYMHYSPEDLDYIVNLSSFYDFETLPEEAGCIGYSAFKDFDCKKRLNVLILYCKPEYRGKYFYYMLRRIEEIAKDNGCESIVMGASISGYKEQSFNKALERFGYSNIGYIKEL